MTKRSRRSILIVDDHPVVIYGLRLLLEPSPHFAVCGEARDADTARERALALQPDYIILDLVLGGRDGILLMKDLLGIASSARVLVYSSQSEWRSVRRTLRAGASGHVAKSEGLPVLVHALETIETGEPFLSPAMRQRMLAEVKAEVPTLAKAGLDHLSDREMQVFRMIGEGCSSRAIADSLGVSIKTVGTYCERIKIKFELDSFRDLYDLARDHMAGRDL